ncbi:hypothetical protein C9374_003227 [Naegleria lovaniensis]|uniref:Poly [ADP-ribose] polymerase n=1 Tax=Naegleria lovaniensis TaxID=51637 RepID=A0AA88KKS6_NAELO|nr:uncharacterized protein C9374_003227 [Naegleria lovaniensis]KAG2386078.1 hypothetical protein C9374_003227 [Naegleria lovaniensis]
MYPNNHNQHYQQQTPFNQVPNHVDHHQQLFFMNQPSMIHPNVYHQSSVVNGTAPSSFPNSNLNYYPNSSVMMNNNPQQNFFSNSPQNTCLVPSSQPLQMNIHSSFYQDPALSFGHWQPASHFSGPVIMPTAHVHGQNVSHIKNGQKSPQTETRSASSSTSSQPKNDSDKKDEIPEASNFCLNWKRCSLTRSDPQHKCEFRHLCTIKNCDKWKDNKIHKARFIHICAHGEQCRYQDNEDHNHNFIHPCSFGGKCKYLNDPLHRIRFSHNDLEVDDRNFDWPETWTTSPPLSITKCLVNKKNYTRLFSLPKNSDEFKKIESKFVKSIHHSYSSAQVVKIERIENAQKWEEYITARFQIKSKNNGKANEKILYHGCDDATALKIIESGIDYRLTTTGHYGQGAYFAVNASYSHGYAPASSNGHRTIFMCRVIIGEPMVVPSQNKNLTRPYDPTKDKMYDSVQGNPTGTEFVIFDNKQAYAEYLVTYK